MFKYKEISVYLVETENSLLKILQIKVKASLIVQKDP